MMRVFIPSTLAAKAAIGKAADWRFGGSVFWCLAQLEAVDGAGGEGDRDALLAVPDDALLVTVRREYGAEAGV